MGACASNAKDEAARSKKIDQFNREEYNKDQQVLKLLFLGAGESGKSTLLKQMVINYGKGYSAADLKAFVPVSRTNLEAAIRTLCECTVEHKIDLHSQEANDAREKVLGATDDLFRRNYEEIGKSITILWNDEGIKEAYNRRSQLQLQLFDGAVYFLERAEQICSPDYIATPQDVVRARVRTTGIVEKTFQIQGNIFSVFDVGGQRNERKKWIHCFADVTGVLFVAALSAYDQVLYEDSSVNRLSEALQLFGEIGNSPYFESSSIILLLNKRDLFEEKIRVSQIPFEFDGYEGEPLDMEQVLSFITEQFKSRVDENTTVVYPHMVCATDRENVLIVFNSIKDIVIRRSLQMNGLMS